MEAVRAVVGGELVFDAAKDEARVFYAARIAAHEGAHGRRTTHHTFYAVVTQHHVAETATAIRHQHLLNFCAVVGHARRHALAIAQDEQPDGLAVDLSRKARGVEWQGRVR